MNARHAALAALAATACATDTLVGAAPRAEVALAIAPYAFHEECAPLVAGDRIDYRFEAKPPVAFEIYHKEGIAHVASLSRENATADSGIFAVALPRRYCLRWEAGLGGTVLDFRVRVLKAGKT